MDIVVKEKCGQWSAAMALLSAMLLGSGNRESSWSKWLFWMGIFDWSFRLFPKQTAEIWKKDGHSKDFIQDFTVINFRNEFRFWSQKQNLYNLTEMSLAHLGRFSGQLETSVVAHNAVQQVGWMTCSCLWMVVLKRIQLLVGLLLLE